MNSYAARFRSFWVQDVSFITLLFIMGVTIFIFPLLFEQEYLNIQALHVMLMLIFFAGIWSAYTKGIRILSIVLFTLSLILNIECYLSGDHDLKAVLWVTYSLNTIIFMVINLQLLFRDDKFSFHRVMGAVNVYLLLALLGAFLYELVHYAFGESLRGDVTLTSPDENFSEYIYFSLVSLTTVGFGEIQPANAAARMLSVLLSTVGILFPAVVIARLMVAASSIGKEA